MRGTALFQGEWYITEGGSGPHLTQLINFLSEQHLNMFSRLERA